MRPFRLPPTLLAAVAVAACATAAPDAAAPDYTPPAGEPAPPRARLYADCIAEAVAAGRYDRTRDPDTDLIRFTCEGAPARAFFEGLAAWSRARDSQWSREGRTWRSTNRVRRDLFGVDYCSAAGPAQAPAPADHRCVVVLNAGQFLQP